jgi:hypothetical protein
MSRTYQNISRLEATYFHSREHQLGGLRSLTSTEVFARILAPLWGINVRNAHCHDHTELQKYTILLVLAIMEPCLSCIIAAYNNTCCLRNRAGRCEPPLNLIQNPQTHNNLLPQAQIGSISAPLAGRDHQADSGDQLELSTGKHLWFSDVSL